MIIGPWEEVASGGKARGLLSSRGESYPLGGGFSTAHAGGHLATILIVEDSPDNMKLFRTLLTLHGHDVLGLSSGEGLIDQLLDTRPDLVLMDIQLPERDGFALLMDIRREFGTALPVVALTAHAMAGDRERAIGAGFDGYITKPIDIRAFPGQVAGALRPEPRR